MELTVENVANMLYGPYRHKGGKDIKELLGELEWDCHQLEIAISRKQDKIAEIIKRPEIPAHIRSDLSILLNEGNMRAAKALLKETI